MMIYIVVSQINIKQVVFSVSYFFMIEEPDFTTSFIVSPSIVTLSGNSGNLAGSLYFQTSGLA
jgi:hypothetical protein